MDTQNYVDIMIDSLTKKEELLKQIVDYNEAQQTIVTAPQETVFRTYYLKIPS